MTDDKTTFVLHADEARKLSALDTRKQILLCNKHRLVKNFLTAINIEMHTV